MEGNALSFQRVFFDLPSYEFPTPPFERFFIANGWCMGRGQFVTKMRILTPSGKTLEGSTFQERFSLKDLHTPFMTLFRLEKIVFPESGYYTVQIFLDDELRLEYQLELRELPKRN